MAVLHFESHESRQEAFVRRSGVMLSTPTEGVATVLRQTVDWLGSAQMPAPRTVLIPPDPSLALVFPTLGGDLAAACRFSPADRRADEIDRAMSMVGLDRTKLTQASRTLSGGEKCLGAIAKAHLLAGVSDEIVACNPEQWLAPGKRHLLHQVLREYDARPRGWTLLSLDGEDFGGSGTPRSHAVARDKGRVGEKPGDLSFTLRVNNAEVELADASGLTENPPFAMTFHTRLDGTKLQSPAIWSAPNGIGKSVFAQILSGAISPTRGRAEVICGGFGGRARVVMQNPARQLFGKRPREYIMWCFREAVQHSLGEAMRLFHELEQGVANRLTEMGSRTLVGTREDPSSLLQARLALTATRLISGTPLLILDEPGFGLTRDGAHAVVAEVARACRERKVGLLILSHTPGWFADVVVGNLRHVRNDSTKDGCSFACVELWSG